MICLPCPALARSLDLLRASEDPRARELAEVVAADPSPLNLSRAIAYVGGQERLYAAQHGLAVALATVADLPDPGPPPPPPRG